MKKHIKTENFNSFLFWTAEPKDWTAEPKGLIAEPIIWVTQPKDHGNYEWTP